MGGAVSAGEDNDELIDKLVNAAYIKTPTIECIFRAVDRGFYYLPSQRNVAYRDQAWRCNNLHLSAPCIYSEVMEALQLKPGLSFLNIGSGTGYLSTLAGLLLGARGTNHGIELHSEVVKYASNKLHEFLSHSPALYRYDFAEPCFVVGNAITVLSEDPIKHQYDRVYCGAAVPPELECFMKSLLKINGILVMPFGDHLVQVTCKTVSEYETKSILPVNFASLVTPSSQSSNVTRHENKRVDPFPEDDSSSSGSNFSCSKLPEFQPFSLKVLCRFKILQLLRCASEVEIINERGTANHLKSQASKRQDGRIAKTAKIARKVSQRLTAPIFEETDSSSSTSSSIAISVASVLTSDDGISDSDKSYAGDSSNNENTPGQRGNSVILQASSRPIELEVSTSEGSRESSKSATDEAQSTTCSSASASNGNNSSESASRDGHSSAPAAAAAAAAHDGHFSTDMLYIDRLRNIIDSATSISHALSRFIHSGLEEEPSYSSPTSSSSSPVTSGPEHLTEYATSEKTVNGIVESADSNGESGKVSGGSRCSFADSGIASASSGSAMESSSKRSISVTGEKDYCLSSICSLY